MRTTVKGKNLEIAADDRRYVEGKLRRLERLLDDRSEALVEFDHESHRSPATSHIVTVTLDMDGRTVRGTARAATHRAAIDEVIDKIERRVVENKDRPLVARDARPEPPSAAETEEPDTERPLVVKIKRFAIEPMFEEDAVGQMEELGHSFFVFVNAENEHLAILYRRRDGHYGMIEPQIGGLYTQPRGAAASPPSAATGRPRRRAS